LRADPVWLFDLDNTLHDASHAAFRDINERMTAYIERELALDRAAADELRRRYWLRYGATLLGLVRHHGVKAQHFLHHTHVLPGLEERVRGHVHDFAALARLRGRKYILTNAPADYTRRVLGVLGIEHLFDGVIPIERMAMFGHLRPKPDARMLRRVAARLRVHPARCVLVEDTVGHLKSARRVGMGTVWMQRFTRGATWGIAAATRVTATPAYVDRRITGLRGLERQCLPAPKRAPAV
jgi:putative hydrolase of the HAD superfamily